MEFPFSFRDIIIIALIVLIWRMLASPLFKGLDQGTNAA